MRPLVQEAISCVMDLKDLRFIGFSHFESDECGSINEFLGLAPNAEPLCGRVNAMINGDCFDRPARVLADEETLSLGKYRLRWFDTPHLPQPAQIDAYGNGGFRFGGMSHRGSLR